MERIWVVEIRVRQYEKMTMFVQGDWFPSFFKGKKADALCYGGGGWRKKWNNAQRGGGEGATRNKLFGENRSNTLLGRRKSPIGGLQEEGRRKKKKLHNKRENRDSGPHEGENLWEGTNSLIRKLKRFRRLV